MLLKSCRDHGLIFAAVVAEMEGKSMGKPIEQATEGEASLGIGWAIRQISDVTRAKTATAPAPSPAQEKAKDEDPDIFADMP